MITGITQDCGTQRFHLLRAHTRAHAHQEPVEKAMTPKKLGQTYQVVLEGLLKRWRAAGVQCRDKVTHSSNSWEYSFT